MRAYVISASFSKLIAFVHWKALTSYKSVWICYF